MPMPRKHADAAARQAAYRDRKRVSDLRAALDRAEQRQESTERAAWELQIRPPHLRQWEDLRAHARRLSAAVDTAQAARNEAESLSRQLRHAEHQLERAKA